MTQFRAAVSVSLGVALAPQGAEPAGGAPEEFAAYLRAEAARWAPVVRASGAKAD